MTARIVGVWVLALVGLCAAIALWPDAPTLICFAITLGLFGVAIGYLGLEVHLEHRRNRRDRVRTGPGNDPGGPLRHPGYTIAGDPTTHSPGTRVVEEPIKAWKKATLCFYPGNRAEFAGYAGAVYGAEATAECRADKKHSAPNPKCGCGFYALKDRNAIGPPWGSTVLLEVELYGNVMVGEKGYRAEKQRVLAVYASRDFHAQRCQYRDDGSSQGRWAAGIQASSNPPIASWMGSVTLNPVWPAGAQSVQTQEPSSTHRGAVGYIDIKTGRVLCAFHAIRAFEDGAPIREYVREFPAAPDTGTEWHWVDDK